MSQTDTDRLRVTEPLIDHALQMNLEEDQIQHLVAQLLSRVSGELKLYVVIGRTGLFANRVTWVVRGFLSRARADEFALDCQEATSELEKQRQAGALGSQNLFRELPSNFIDPKAKHIDGYPPSYSVTAVPLSGLQSLDLMNIAVAR